MADKPKTQIPVLKCAKPNFGLESGCSGACWPQDRTNIFKFSGFGLEIGKREPSCRKPSTIIVLVKGLCYNDGGYNGYKNRKQGSLVAVLGKVVVVLVTVLLLSSIIVIDDSHRV